SLRRILKGRHIPDARAREWMARKNRYYQEMIARLTPDDVLPGVLSLLEEIHRAKMKVAVASASKNAAAVIERLELFPRIDALCDGHSVDRPKPAPDLFLYAARALDTLPGRCVVIEDAQAGIEAARAAGMWAVALGPVARFRGAHLVLPSLADTHLGDILHRLQTIAES
ncbi:MAG: HAD family hydrolase, partial [Anaerolineae bacterium]